MCQKHFCKVQVSLIVYQHHKVLTLCITDEQTHHQPVTENRIYLLFTFFFEKQWIVGDGVLQINAEQGWSVIVRAGLL